MQSPVDFYGRFQPWSKNIQSPFFNSGERLITKPTGPGCSKLTMPLVNVSCKISNLNISNKTIFLVKKCEKLFSFFSTKMSVFLVIKYT